MRIEDDLTSIIHEAHQEYTSRPFKEADLQWGRFIAQAILSRLEVDEDKVYEKLIKNREIRDFMREAMLKGFEPILFDIVKLISNSKDIFKFKVEK